MFDICKSFFEYLNSHNIRYCHWKSNVNLKKGLSGKTDLDILVHKYDKKEFEMVFEKFALKKIISPPEKQFSGMEDYLGFDYKTGSLIHLHVHYSLVLGQKYIKNHHLPIEEIIFQNLITKDNIYIPCPDMELILLTIRAHMKIDFISIIKHGVKDMFGGSYTSFPTDIENEFVGLIHKIDIEKLKDILRQSRLPISEEIFLSFVTKFSDGNLRCYDVLKTKWQILSALKQFRRQKSIFSYLKYLSFSISNLQVINNLRKPKKKTLISKGKILSIVGADGSGKSTLVKDLENWLSWKLTVIKYYYGIPKTNFIKFLSYAIRGFKKFRLVSIATFLEHYLWICIAKKRYKIFLLSQKDTNKGKIVITDRFPLKDFQNMAQPMDGPRLNQSNTKIGSYFSRMETRYYDRIIHPDRIFVLQIAIEDLRRRKNDLDITTHKIKNNAVNAVKENERFIQINANRPYSEVLLELKRRIWEIL